MKRSKKKMKALDVICRMQSTDLVTVEDYKKGEILIDRDTPDRICAFDEVDNKIHNILRNYSVYKITIGKVFGDIILSVVSK
jgi:hypothetical protein